MGNTAWLIVGAVVLGSVAANRLGLLDRKPVVDDVAATLACENALRGKLKAPSTASFSGGMDTRVSQREGLWAVEGYVDAQNGFGAQIRSRYSCSVTFNGAAALVVSAEVL